MNPINIESIISIAVRVDLVLTMRRDGNLGITTKSNITDLVTEADLASESRRTLRPQPTFTFWAKRARAAQPKSSIGLSIPLMARSTSPTKSPMEVTIALQQGEQRRSA